MISACALLRGLKDHSVQPAIAAHPTKPNQFALQLIGTDGADHAVNIGAKDIPLKYSTRSKKYRKSGPYYAAARHDAIEVNYSTATAGDLGELFLYINDVALPEAVAAYSEVVKTPLRAMPVVKKTIGGVASKKTAEECKAYSDAEDFTFRFKLLSDKKTNKIFYFRLIEDVDGVRETIKVTANNVHEYLQRDYLTSLGFSMSRLTIRSDGNVYLSPDLNVIIVQRIADTAGELANLNLDTATQELLGL